MSGIYTRGADLARDVVDHRQSHAALLSDAATLLTDLRDLSLCDGADVLVSCFLAAGTYGRISGAVAERAYTNAQLDAAAASTKQEARNDG